MKAEERFSCYSHLFGAIIGIFGLISLLVLAWGNTAKFLVVLQFGLGVLFCFSASANYHYRKQEENEITLSRKIDHIAIFFIIAGFFTALSYFYLSAPVKWIIIGIQWGTVLIGLILKIFFMNAPRVISPIIYMAMGLSALIPFPQMLGSMSDVSKFCLLMGALTLSCGAVIYATKKPDPKPPMFGFHEIFHIFIVIGVYFFYYIIFDTLVLSVGL